MESPKMCFCRRCNKRTYFVGPQTTPTHVRQYRAENGILGKSGATFHHGAVFAPKQRLYLKRKLGLWRAKKCIPLVGAISGLTCAGPQTTLTHVRQFSAENGILGKSGATFCHGSVFAPKQEIYQMEARAMESPKMYSSRQCNKRTYLCGSAFAPKQYLGQKVAVGKENPKYNRLIGAINALGVTARQITRFHAPCIGPRM